MNQSLVAPKASAVKAASAATVSVFNTVSTAANTLNSGVVALGRLAQAADLKSDEWLFGIQSECIVRRPAIAALAELTVITEVGARFKAHRDAMKDPDFAASFTFAEEMLGKLKTPAPVAAAA